MLSVRKAENNNCDTVATNPCEGTKRERREEFVLESRDSDAPQRPRVLPPTRTNHRTTHRHGVRWVPRNNKLANRLHNIRHTLLPEEIRLDSAKSPRIEQARNGTLILIAGSFAFQDTDAEPRRNTSVPFRVVRSFSPREMKQHSDQSKVGLMDLCSRKDRNQSIVRGIEGL